MKNIRSKSGPTKQKPFFKSEEIEEICTSELKKFNLFPSKPEPIRIERFIEKKFGVTPIYVDVDPGILGFTKFGTKGVQEIYIAKSLDDEGSQISSRRIRTTLAHEAGHGLLHSHIFALGKGNPGLFNDEQPDEPKILCREVIGTQSINKKYDGRWWEYQANKAMAALLLPKALVYEAMRPYMEKRGLLGGEVLDESKRNEAISFLSDIFDINPIVVRYRLEDLFPLTNSLQMSL